MMMIAGYYDGRASALLYHLGRVERGSFSVLNDSPFIACDYKNKRRRLSKKISLKKKDSER